MQDVINLMQARFLNANWSYFDGVTKKSSKAVVVIAKAVFLLIGAGCFSEAAALAGTDEIVKEIWELSLM